MMPGTLSTQPGATGLWRRYVHTKPAALQISWGSAATPARTHSNAVLPPWAGCRLLKVHGLSVPLQRHSPEERATVW